MSSPKIHCVHTYFTNLLEPKGLKRFIDSNVIALHFILAVGEAEKLQFTSI